MMCVVKGVVTQMGMKPVEGKCGTVLKWITKFGMWSYTVKAALHERVHSLEFIRK